ncbi:efflux transporter outer membrane subunit [Novosphingobium sp. FKTRR1]|uniref:efflux transporter outer membrane subunit n=1 Tax=Novosphingobium sp. FKTRR1 TaxID=2879118 RepID=UPI00351CBB19
MMTLRTGLSTCAALLLAGCSMAPHYVRPTAPVPPALPQGPAYAALTAGDGQVDAMGWHDFFTDPQLQAVIGTALANNRDLRVTIANVELARTTYRQQRAANLPAITAGGTASAVHNGSLSSGASGTGQSGTTESFAASAGTSAFEIDLWGRKASLTRAAFESYLASDEGRKAATIALVGEVATAWLTYAANADALAVAQQTLASQTRTLKVTQRREGDGIGTKLDVAQAQTQVESARADVADFTTALAQAKNALDLLVGQPVGSEQLPTTLGNGDQVRASLPVGLDSAVLLRRPDVLQAEHTLQGANANIGAARAAFFPTISLTGLLGFASSSLSGLFDAGQFRWNASGSLSQTLFDGGVKANALAGAKASRDAAIASYEKAIQSAFRDVADALARRGTIDARVDAAASLLSNAELAASLSQKRYDAGVATYLEPLTAQRTAYSARQGLVTARLTKATNMVTLYRVLGGGLKP